MSGSFHAPGPAYSLSSMFCSKMLTTLLQLARMSVVVRHRLPTSEPQVHDWPLVVKSQML